MRTLLLLLLLGLLPLTARPQAAPSVSGRVLDEQGQALPGATVYLQETLQGTQTDGTGAFSFRGLRPGRYHLRVSLLGFAPETRPVEVPGLSQSPPAPLRLTLRPSSQALQEVVVEASPLALDRRESPVLTERADEAFIQRNTGHSLMHTLEKLPGVSAINMGVGVSKPVIRGLGFNRVLVTDSGIRQEGQQWGSDHGLEIDQYSVEQVEIVKGPASLTHGSDALGGVVRILHPVAVREGLHRASVKAVARTVNDTYGLTAASAGNHRGLSYRLRLTRLGYGDYKVPAPTFRYNRFVLPLYENRLKNTAGQERHLSLTGGLNRKWGYSHLTLSNYNQQVGIFSGAMGIPRAYQLTPDGDRRNIDLPSQDINHLKVISNSSLMLGRGWLEADLGLQRNRRKEFSQPHAHGLPQLGPEHPGPGTLATRLDLETLTANLRFHAPLGRQVEGVYGLQAQTQRNTRDGFEFLIPDYRSRQVGLFALHKARLGEQVVLTGGLRLDHTGLRAEEVREAFFHGGRFLDTFRRSPPLHRSYTGLSGALGAAYSPSGRLSLKLNLGKTFRPPAAPELLANGMHHGTFRYEQGDPALRPEHGLQLDLGLSYEAPRLQFAVTPFFNLFRHYIFLSPAGVFPTVRVGGELYPVAEAGQLYRFRQAGALHTGAEATARYALLPALHLGLTAEYVWARNQDTRLPLPFTPPLALRPHLEAEQKKITGFLRNGFLRLHYGLFAPQERVERNEEPTPGYGVVDLSAGLSLGAREWAQLTVQVQNLTDRTYYHHLSRYRILNLPEPGRNFVLSLAVQVERERR